MSMSDELVSATEESGALSMMKTSTTMLLKLFASNYNYLIMVRGGYFYIIILHHQEIIRS